VCRIVPAVAIGAQPLQPLPAQLALDAVQRVSCPADGLRLPLEALADEALGVAQPLHVILQAKQQLQAGQPTAPGRKVAIQMPRGGEGGGKRPGREEIFAEVEVQGVRNKRGKKGEEEEEETTVRLKGAQKKEMAATREMQEEETGAALGEKEETEMAAQGKQGRDKERGGAKGKERGERKSVPARGKNGGEKEMEAAALLCSLSDPQVFTLERQAAFVELCACNDEALAAMLGVPLPPNPTKPANPNPPRRRPTKFSRSRSISVGGKRGGKARRQGGGGPGAHRLEAMDTSGFITACSVVFKAV